MLEKQDIQTIAEIFNSSMKPIKRGTSRRKRRSSRT